MGLGKEETSLTFGADPDKRTDPGFFFFLDSASLNYIEALMAGL